MKEGVVKKTEGWPTLGFVVDKTMRKKAHGMNPWASEVLVC